MKKTTLVSLIILAIVLCAVAALAMVTLLRNTSGPSRAPATDTTSQQTPPKEADPSLTPQEDPATLEDAEEDVVTDTPDAQLPDGGE